MIHYCMIIVIVNLRFFFEFVNKVDYYYYYYYYLLLLLLLLSFVSNEVIISIQYYGMWIPVLTETTGPDTLGKQGRKRVSCREKKPKLVKLSLVYKVQRCLGTQISVEKNFSFRQTLLVV